MSWFERHDYAASADPFEVDNDLHDGWACSGCDRHFGDTDRGPQMEIDDPKGTLLFCGMCVEDGRFPQPTEEIIVTHCPHCSNLLSDADRLLINAGCVRWCSHCCAVLARVRRSLQPESQESIWRANWDRLGIVAAWVWIGVCAIAGVVAGVLR